MEMFVTNILHLDFSHLKNEIIAPPRRQHYEESEGSTTEEDEETEEDGEGSGEEEEEESPSPPRKSQRRSHDTEARQGKPAVQSRLRERGKRRAAEGEDEENEDVAPTSRSSASRRAPSDLSVSPAHLICQNYSKGIKVFKLCINSIRLLVCKSSCNLVLFCRYVNKL